MKSTTEIANELLHTYNGVEGTAINPSSWFNEIVDTSSYYGVSTQYASEAHHIAYNEYLSN